MNPTKQSQSAATKSAETPGQSELNATTVKQEVQPLLKKADYAKAVTVIHTEVQKGLSEDVMAGEYIVAVNGTISQAEGSLRADDHAHAGQLFQTVLSAYPQSERLSSQAVLTPEQLTTEISHCAEELMEKGLSAYRSGELATAISLWQQILEFDQQHETARKAIRTTELQLTNLKNLEI